MAIAAALTTGTAPATPMRKVRRALDGTNTALPTRAMQVIRRRVSTGFIAAGSSVAIAP